MAVIGGPKKVAGPVLPGVGDAVLFWRPAANPKWDEPRVYPVNAKVLRIREDNSLDLEFVQVGEFTNVPHFSQTNGRPPCFADEDRPFDSRPEIGTEVLVIESANMKFYGRTTGFGSSATGLPGVNVEIEVPETVLRCCHGAQPGGWTAVGEGVAG